MGSIDRQARVAGLLYLLAGIPAPFGLVYVPHMLVVPGDATATADRIRASETLLRLGITCELFVATAFIFVALALYRLLERVDRDQARAMWILYVMSVPISFLNVLHEIAALVLARGGGPLSVFEPRQLDALASLFMRLHGQGLFLAEIFWGLWLLPLGILVIRSGFIPRGLGVWLILNGFAYLAVCTTNFLAPRHTATVSRVTFPLLLGELAMMLWLLIAGVRPRPQEVPAA